MKELYKGRSVYIRQEIVHICFKGQLWGPAPGVETSIRVGDKADVIPIQANGYGVAPDEAWEGERILIQGNSNGVVELWCPREIFSKRGAKAKAAQERREVAEAEATLAEKQALADQVASEKVERGTNLLDLM